MNSYCLLVCFVITDGYANPAFTAEELQEVVKDKKKSGRPNTTGQYSMQRDKLHWFCNMDPSTYDATTRKCSPRTLPYDPEAIATREGLDLACHLIKWARRNFPGMKYSLKAKILGKSTFEQFHSALQDHYQQLLIKHKNPDNLPVRTFPYKCSFDPIT